MSSKRKAVQDSSEESDTESSDDSNDDPNHFVLPPEYKENDRRWTLKYQNNDKGLVELKENTRVYVNAEVLETYNKIVKTFDELIRLLMDEVFTTNALSICSMTGTKPRSNVVAKVRPGLDKTALKAVIDYAHDFAEKHNIKPKTKQEIHGCINSKLYQTRLKNASQKQSKNTEPIKSKPKHKKASSQEISSYQLRPEDESEDTKWTLKHREKSKDAVELIEDSGVYIDDVVLARAKLNSKECNKLALNLLEGVFSSDGLAIATMPVPKLTANSIIEHGLDQKALTVLLKYVEDFGQGRGWKFNSRSIIRSIGGKMRTLKQYRDVDNSLAGLPPVKRRKPMKWGQRELVSIDELSDSSLDSSD